ncbi:MAG TPA: DUF3108 domain-containing protein [Dehalococcoidia bacterium]|nr:DUF3108 domain-containing protein [Dehalococcoidia bacterium]
MGSPIRRSRFLRITLAGFATLTLGVACVGGSQPDNQAVVGGVPFEAGEQAVYALHDNSGEVVARGTLAVTRDGDQLLLAQSYTLVDGDGEPTDEVLVTVDATSLTPLRLARTVQTADGEDRYAAGYEAVSNDAAAVLLDSTIDGNTEQRELELGENYYDNECSLWLWRTLDFADGYVQRYTAVNHLDRNQQTVILRVIDRQTVEVPAGTFEAWRLQVRNGRATRVAWINVDAPHQIVQWDNGSIVFRLKEFHAGGR